MRSLVAVGALLLVVFAGPSHAGDGSPAAGRRPTRVLGRAFLQSPQGREFLGHSAFPKAADWRRLFHGETRAAPVPGEPAPAPVTSAQAVPQDPGTVSSVCGGVA